MVGFCRFTHALAIKTAGIPLAQKGHVMRSQTSSLDRPTATGWRTSPAPTLVALVVIVSLLMAFYQVVSGAVQQAEARRHAAAVQADATWRCNTQSAAPQRMSCLTRLRSAPAGDPAAADAQLATLAHAVR